MYNYLSHSAPIICLLATSRVSQFVSQQGVYTEELVSPESRINNGGRQSPPLPLNLCICVKRRLFFFRWSPAHRNFVSPSALASEDPVMAAWPPEYTLSESAQWVHFCGSENIIIGLRSDYLRFNLRSREVIFDDRKRLVVHS